MMILDSDHCIAILRGRLDLREFIVPSDVLYTTTISVAELTYGAYKSVNPDKNISRLEVLLATLITLPFDIDAARQFGPLKSNLERQGKRIADLDLQIASIALSRQLPLGTHNQRHFSRVPELQLEDWLE